MSRFRKYAKTYFTFLNQFGYTISKECDADIVSFMGKNNRVDILFSTFSYELSCQFTNLDNKTFSLQDGLEYESVEEIKGFYQIASEEGIEKGLHYLSEAVKILFERIDISDLVNFQKIYKFSIDKHKNLLEKYYLETDLKKAEVYWQKKEYIKAKELFEKNIDYLSASQRKKLEYIINRIM